MEVWRKAQDLSVSIYSLCNTNEKITKDFSFKDQIKQAALSISNNIAEGFEYSNNNDFFRFLRIAKGSCGDVRNCLLFASRLNYISPHEAEKYIEFSRKLGKQIDNLMKYLKENDLKQNNGKTRNP